MPYSPAALQHSQVRERAIAKRWRPLRAIENKKAR
jgi:hypothetical protein